MAVGAAGCSSTEDAFVVDDGYGDGGYPGPNGAMDDEDEVDPAGGDSGGDPGGDTGDGGSEPAPAPDDEGIDNGSDLDGCDAQADVTLFLSPDDSNSMSSPVQARAAVLSDWGSVQSVAIRTWEFFNYYGFGYPAAPEPGAVAVTPSLLAGEAEGEFLLQIGVSSHSLSAATREPINVTLVLDTSGSMSGHPMDMLEASSLAIVGSLDEGDTVSMVTWDTSNAIVLGGYHVTGPNDPVVVEAITSLEAGGGTDLH
ncbi:MAG: hypothetical protein KDK70_16185, partial [Myxococcales bacterium]|nr:hypothetical protein [Myxococcales bacterium]